MRQDSLEFPVIELVEGGINDDIQVAILRLSTVEQQPICFGLRYSDIESFVTFLLCMAAGARGAAPNENRARYQPIPVSAISAGQLADGMGCLGVTVGGTELMFQMPLAALAEAAQTLLLVGSAEGERTLS